MRNDVHAAISVCGKGKARLNVVCCEIRKIIKHLGNGHTASEIIKDVGYGNARSADTGLSAADHRVNADSLAIVHDVRVTF